MFAKENDPLNVGAFGYRVSKPVRKLRMKLSPWRLSKLLMGLVLLVCLSNSSLSAQENEAPAKPATEAVPAVKEEAPQETEDVVKTTDENGATEEESMAWPKRSTLEQKVARVFGPPPGMTRLAKDARIWIDTKNKRLVVDGYVALRVGQLEMFACPAGTKEHESVVGLLTKAQYVHAGLLAIGAKPGSPVKFEPKYTPAHGSKIKIEILYVSDKGEKKRVVAQDWVRQVGTEKTLDMDWVFAGSGLWKDPETGKEQYLAESGDLICVSNFTTATLDLPVRSSQANSSLLFAAFTDRIPPEQTPVRLVLTIKDEEEAK
jgi:hypothetical protein